MKKLIFLILLLLIQPVAVQFAHAAGDGNLSLKNDPFASEPAPAQPQATAPTSSESSKPAPPTSGNPATEIEWLPELRAVIYSETDPLVNLNGRILTIGETFNGFRVIEIGNQSVTMLHKKKKVKLSLKDWIPTTKKNAQGASPGAPIAVQPLPDKTDQTATNQDKARQ